VAITIFGGLVTATVLDTFLTPTLFLRYGRNPLERLVAQARTAAADQAKQGALAPVSGIEAF
jgi:HME family heavy-metal exporter